MGAQWKQAGRVANATKRGALIGKLVKEIVVSAKLGDPSPEFNPRLFAACEAARKHSVPRDTIDRAIKRGAGLTGEKTTYELVTYEGFAPHQVPVMVECLTDNRNRTAPEIRHIFRDAQLGMPGSVSWMFDHLGVIEAHHPEAGTDIETAGIEAGAQNVEKLETTDVPSGHIGARFMTLPTDLDAVAKWLSKARWVILSSEMNYIAKNRVDLDEAKRKEVEAFLGEIDDHEDVHRLYTALG